MASEDARVVYLSESELRNDAYRPSYRLYRLSTILTPPPPPPPPPIPTRYDVCVESLQRTKVGRCMSGVP